MPDHVHLAVEGRRAGSDLRRFVKIAKQRVAYVARTEFSIPMVWQSGYYERVIRWQGMSRVVSYILNNPVKAGFVQRAEQYPFSGSSLQ
jgi:REP element-mobilizing transposase RayT